MTAPIIIAEFDPVWAKQFDTLRSRIAPALGPLAAAIEHVGSTAVTGLAAKPIIDIDVLLRGRDDLAAAIKKLYPLGYLHRGDLGIPGRESFRAPPQDFPHHLYLCLPQYREFDRHIAFRDYLRAHPKDVVAYARLKRQLAVEQRANRDAYTQAKSEFVEFILQSANSDRGTF
jgi:GrpB-like predicted nucleotidyltransferase (UPF0157 family)